MTRRFRERLTYANVTATLALFLVLTGGTVYALDGKNTVNSGDIINEEVRAADLAPASVARSELDPLAFAAPDIADEGSGNFEIPDNAIQGFEVTDNALRGLDINEATLDLDLDRDDASSPTNSYSPKQAFATCPEGWKLIGTGASIQGGTVGNPPDRQQRVTIGEIHAFAGTVTVTAYETAGGTTGDWRVEAQAICARLAG